jgi:hypothetical protein
MRARRLGILLAVAALTGCTQIVHGTAVARLSLPVNGFPGTAGYTAVNSDSFYIRDGNPEYGFSFDTPNGFACTMGTFPIWRAARVHCTGLRADKGPGYWTVTAERFRSATIKTSPKPRRPRYRRAHPNKVLPQRHYVVDSVDTLCLVTQDSIVACHVGGHGFILTPDKTTLF